MIAHPSEKVFGFIRKIFVKDDDIVEEEPVETGAAPISSIHARDRVHLIGTVEATSSTPEGWRAEVSDGTGTVTLLWMGRTAIPGVTVGTTMHVWGRAAAQRTGLLIYNPAYAIQAPPEGQYTP